jgi:hypothetical protein
MSITTQKALRAAFWRDNPGLSRRMIPAYSGKGRMYCTDIRVAWCDYVESQARAGVISEALADRATLQPSRVAYEFEIQGDYGHGHGFEVECSESTRAEALKRLQEYRENGPGVYRLRRRRILQSREG